MTKQFLVLAFVAAALPAGAQTIQLEPFAGYQFGGSLSSPVFEQGFSLKSGLSYGGTLDIAINKGWRVELLYSRQDSDLEASGGPGPHFDLAVERYLVGIQEEKGGDANKTRVFGVFFLGGTRFIPGLPGYDSNTLFTLGLSLGVKVYASKNVGFRFEGRGFFSPVNSEATLVCSNGACLFGASGNGFWQGEVSAGLILAF